MIGNFVDFYQQWKKEQEQKQTQAEQLDARRKAHEAQQKQFTPYNPQEATPPSRAGGAREDLTSLMSNAGSLVSSLQDPRLQIIELMKEAYTSTYGAESQRSSGEQQASAIERGQLSRLLEGDGSLAGNRPRGLAFGGSSSRARAGIDSGALRAIQAATNKSREEEAYQLMQERNALDLASQKTALRGQQYEVNRKPAMDNWKRNLIMHLLRGVM